MKFNLTVATFAVLFSAGSLGAQQTLPGQPQSNLQKANAGSTTDSSLTKDQALLKCLAISNQEQVTIAKFAKEKSTSEEVKAFATTLAKAHQDCVDELKKLETKTASSKKSSNPTSQVAIKNADAIDFLQIHQEMSDQCLKDAKEMLSKKEGAEFDTCFVGMQISKHSMMHSALTVLQRHAEGELQGFIKKNLAKNDQHAEAATTLMDDLSEKISTKLAKDE